MDEVEVGGTRRLGQAFCKIGFFMDYCIPLRVTFGATWRITIGGILMVNFDSPWMVTFGDLLMVFFDLKMG